MRKELPYFNVENDFGGDQHKLDRYITRRGGCAAVTACDCCIYFELYKNLRGLYPYDVKNISYKNYRQFTEIMTPYLHPRMMGIDKLQTYIDGFKKFLSKCNVELNFVPIEGTENFSVAWEKVLAQINDGWLIPCLTLEHKNPELKTYVWHWFLLTGCDEENFQVKVTTYGSFRWINFAELWDTGFERKGGIVLIQKT